MKELIEKFLSISRLFFENNEFTIRLRLENTYKQLSLNKDNKLVYFFIRKYANPVMNFIATNRFVDIEIDDDIVISGKNTIEYSFFKNLASNMTYEKILEKYIKELEGDDNKDIYNFKDIFSFVTELMFEIELTDINTIKQKIIYIILNKYSSREICRDYEKEIDYILNKIGKKRSRNSLENLTAVISVLIDNIFKEQIWKN